MRRVLLCAAVVLVVGCTEGPSEPPQKASAFGALAREVFEPRCTGQGCHRGPDPAGGLDLTAGKAYADLVNVPATRRPDRVRVVPGNPAASYLMERLVPEGDTPVMPLGADPLSAADLARIRDWIREGAPGP